MYYYAASDMHGNLPAFMNALINVDLSNGKNKLFLLGDYIGRGDKSCELLYFIKDMQTQYGDQVVVLMGNHEEAFLEWIDDPFGHARYCDDGFEVIKSFLRENPIWHKDLTKQSEMTVAAIKEKHHELIDWLKSLPLYFETEEQVFVHAGILEEAGDLWKQGTPAEYFTSKFPPKRGVFHKDIIAGHVATAALADNPNHFEVYWDGENHFFIDGRTTVSNFVPVLKYDTVSCTYTTFREIELPSGKMKWEEVKII